MKNIISTLVLCTVCLMPSSKGSAQEFDYGQQENVGIRLPLNFLMNWELEDYSSRSVFFESRDNEDVGLVMGISKELPEEVTIDLVVDQLSNYLNGFSSDISLIFDVFSEDTDVDLDDYDEYEDEYDFEIEDVDFEDVDDFEVEDDYDNELENIDFLDDFVFVEDDLNVDELENEGLDEIIDIDELGFEDVSEFSQITLNNINWIMVQFASPVVITEYPSDEPGYVSSVKWERHIVFLTLMNNRLYAVDISAPVEIYYDYEGVMFDAISEISEFADVMLGVDPQAGI